MNKVVYLIIVLVISALAGGVYITKSSDEEQSSDNMSQSETNSLADSADAAEGEAEINVPSTGSQPIQAYSTDALAASTTDNNLLFFHAAWCTVCNSVERNLEAGSIPDDLTIFKIDYDSDLGQDLARNYIIPIQYTMVQVDTEGNEITQWVNNFGDGVDEISGRLL